MEALDFNTVNLTDDDAKYISSLKDDNKKVVDKLREYNEITKINIMISNICADALKIKFSDDELMNVKITEFNDLIKRARDCMSIILDLKDNEYLSEAMNAEVNSLSNPFSGNYIVNEKDREDRKSEIEDYYLSKMYFPF